MRRMLALAVVAVPSAALLFAARLPAAPDAPAKPAAADTKGDKAAGSKAEPGTPGEVLASKGLEKAGTNYVLRGDRDLADKMKAIALAKTKMNNENKDRGKIEAKIKSAKAQFAQLDFERRNQLQRLAGVKDATQNNQIVAKIEQLEAAMKDGREYIDNQNKELAKIGDDDKTKYVNLILDTATEVEKTEKDYADLAADDGVKSALTDVKGKLGPSPEFVANAAQIKRLRANVSSETIDVKMDNNVPMVQVTLNKSFTQEMVLDSGASTIAIPADLAKRMELIPGKDDPIVHLQMADGKVVEGKLTHLKSVRVGSFTVENVECAVLPPDLVAAEPLLGNSFLQNFTYKLDTANGKLHLAQVADGTKKPAPKDPKEAKDSK